MPISAVFLFIVILKVTVYTGDMKEELVMAGDRLTDAQEVMTKADTLPMPRSIRHAQKYLMKKVMG